VSPENLALYEVQKPFIEPILRSWRLWNTTFDTLFYDVGLLTTALLTKGVAVSLRWDVSAMHVFDAADGRALEDQKREHQRRDFCRLPRLA
jgi:hypothetical protein